MMLRCTSKRSMMGLGFWLCGAVLLLSCKSDPLSRCGNGVVDEGEKCDGNCPTSCDDRIACTTEALVGSAATCDAVCTFAAVTECKAGDGCCAPGCNANNDSDCSLSCGNGVQEEKETCDGNCPSSCNDAQDCTTDTLVGAAAMCSASCSYYTSITTCQGGDACCPPGCNANSDSDCSPTCSNGAVESGEQCDDGNIDDSDACNTSCRWTVVQVATGGITPVGVEHTCALLSSGAVRCWGGNHSGALGYGDTNYRTTPGGDVNVGGTVTQIAAGYWHTCALLSSGAVRCWGLGDDGQLGYGDNVSHLTPGGDVNVGGTVTQIAAGYWHTCALLSNGAVRCWGEGQYGRLGYGNTNDIGDNETPASAGDVNVGGTVTQVAAGGDHTCALLSNGKVRCWGRGDSGQLGYGNSRSIGDNETPASAGDVNVGGTVTQLAAGFNHTCALLSNGAVRCWGSGEYGKLGYGNTSQVGDDETPASAGDVNVGGTVTQIATGGGHTCALLSSGTVRCWGGNHSGALGYTYIDSRTTPGGDVNVGGTVTQIATGGGHTCARLSSGTVRCWGLGEWGELGYGNTLNIGDDESPSSVGPVPVNP